eukprot:scaffold29226_cov70-Phaeocystis_antarctica.AAC.1
MPGLTVKDYVRHGGGAPLMPLSAVARSDLAGLAFRDGYAPFAPFTGSLLDESLWRRRNRRRLAVLLQPAGLWGGTAGCHTSCYPEPLTLVQHERRGSAERASGGRATHAAPRPPLDLIAAGSAARAHAPRLLAALPTGRAAAAPLPRAGRAVCAAARGDPPPPSRLLPCAARRAPPPRPRRVLLPRVALCSPCNRQHARANLLPEGLK